jgi:hypothetical protein
MNQVLNCQEKTQQWLWKPEVFIQVDRDRTVQKMNCPGFLSEIFIKLVASPDELSVNNRPKERLYARYP